jgi:uncharacterized protein (TIGR03118 family)
MASEAINAQSNISDAQQNLSPSLSGFKEIVLTANKSFYKPLRIDKKLLNAWGMSASDEGEIWVSAADGGVSFVYSKSGGHLMPPVSIPSHEANVPGNPTGNIYNETSDFVIPGTGETSEFIFASEDGTISAWNDPTGSSAVIVADRHTEASYKGLAIANDGGHNYLYVTNFESAKIDVFDAEFHYTTGRAFEDKNLPEGYAPFNIREIDNMLYVTYALRTADGEEDSTGAGLGYVDVFWPNGSLSKRFASQGTLNAPWGITLTKGDLIGMKAILIGNFGDGHINVFDFDGNFKGQLMRGGEPIWIEGLWAIDNTIEGTSTRQLYFTAGPHDEEDGVFGFLAR